MTVKLVYNLCDSDGNDIPNTDILVDKNYTSTNKTISWSNVPQGTYKVKITNTHESVDAKGNGYIDSS
ncbi:hypothetical protein NLX71_07260 [Paenibacillus sp. MZ04-78.2]|uniref:hypothetical protein n=1 Tax=Paenibacillus sp. MZ04-78.2 TaxID=2962034 RepID=UPI0020B709DD|nr:hypothetical protein [Paenibacillus sp. MZ04-78.2]MCP3773117.1 hypothetical protein [Paenibacillus sp. MZ04-78.2]